MKMYGKHQIRRTIYSLKKQWSAPLTWYRMLNTTTDRRTGVKQTNWETAIIKKAILLPKVDTREFKYSLSYLAANKNFVYGGYFDKNKRYAIIEMRDLPRDWVINTEQTEFNDKIIINHDRYALSHTENYDEAGSALFLTLTYIKGSEPNAIIDETVNNTVEVTDESTTP